MALSNSITLSGSIDAHAAVVRGTRGLYQVLSNSSSTLYIDSVLAGLIYDVAAASSASWSTGLWAQSFTTGAAPGSLLSLVCWPIRRSSSDRSLTVYVRSTIDGSNLASSDTVTDANIDETNGTFVNFSTPYALAANTLYYLVFDGSQGGTTGYLNAKKNIGGNPYADGLAYAWSGSQWTQYTSDDWSMYLSTSSMGSLRLWKTSSQTHTATHGSGVTSVAAHAAVDSTGLIHVVSQASVVTGSFDIAYNTYTPGTNTWGTWEQVGACSKQATAAGCSIGIDENDKPHIVYINTEANMGTDYSRVYYANKTGANWSAPAMVSTGTQTNYTRPRLYVTSAADLDVTYQVSTSGNAYSRRYTTSWQSEQTQYSGTVYGFNATPWQSDPSSNEYWFLAQISSVYEVYRKTSGAAGPDVTAGSNFLSGAKRGNQEWMLYRAVTTSYPTLLNYNGSTYSGAIGLTSTAVTFGLIVEQKGRIAEDANVFGLAYDNTFYIWNVNVLASAADTVTVSDAPTLSVSTEGPPAPNQTETITIGESAMLAVSAPQIANTETVTLTESATPAVQEAAPRTSNVTDSIGTAESATATVSAPDGSATDTVTLTESATASVQAAMPRDASAADTVAASDAPVLAVSAPASNVSDGVTLSEIATGSVGAPVVNVADTITFTESATGSVQAAEPRAASVTDTIAVTDAPVLSHTVAASVSDEVTIADVPTINQGAMADADASAADTVTLTETIALQSDVPVSAADTTATTEAATASVSLLSTSVGDTVTLADAPTVTRTSAGELAISATDAATVGEEITAAVSGPVFSVTDGVSTSEAVQLSHSVAANVLDAISTAEAVTAAASSPVAQVADTVTLVDAPTLSVLSAGELGATATDTVTVSEAAAASHVVAASVTDGATVTDAPTLTLANAGELVISIADSVTVQEAVTPVVSAPPISVTDSATLADAPTLTLASAGERAISVAESISAAEVTAATVGNPQASAADTLTLGEALIRDLSIAILVADAVTTGEAAVCSVAAAATLALQADETLTVSETVAVVNAALAFQVADTATLAETLELGFNMMSLAVADGVTIAELIGRWLGVEPVSAWRTLNVEWEERRMNIAREDRTTEVAGENRVYSIRGAE